MSDKNTGGYAFPVEGGAIAAGMTLRDYFAAKAMQGMLASGNLPKSVSDQAVASVAYQMAAAMLEARNG